MPARETIRVGAGRTNNPLLIARAGTRFSISITGSWTGSIALEVAGVIPTGPGPRNWVTVQKFTANTETTFVAAYPLFVSLLSVAGATCRIGRG